MKAGTRALIFLAGLIVSGLTLGAGWLPMENPLHTAMTMPPPLVWSIPLAALALLALIPPREKGKKTPPSAKWISLLLLLVAVLHLGISLPGREIPGQGIKVLTINVHYDSGALPKLSQLIRDEKIDIVLVQENKGAPLEALRRDFADWSMVEEESHAILSRFPLRDSGATGLVNRPWRRILWATAQTPEGPLRVVTTHLSAPQLSRGIGQFRRAGAAKQEEMEQILSVIESDPTPTVFGGDLNNPPAHGFTRLLSGKFENAFSATGTGLGWTYPATLPVIRIDHLYTTHGARPLRAFVGSNVGSDHLPVIAEVQVR